MKSFYAALPGALLLSYAIYSAFVQVNIAHSIILFSLAALFAFNQFLLQRETPKLENELAKLKSEMEQQIGKLKEQHESRLKSAEDEISKIALSSLRSSSSASSAKAATTPPKIFF